MADNTVKFITQYGDSVVSNMASEATMKELLNAVKDLSTGTSGGTGGSGSGSKKGLGTLGKTFKALNDQLGNAVSAGLGFVKLIGKGETQASVFAGHLNDTFIKQLPVVGGVLGGLTGVLVTSIGVLEQWDKSQRTVAIQGATFGNNILRFRTSAARAYMDLDEFTGLITDNIEKLNGLGFSTQDGIDKFLRFSDGIRLGAGSARNVLYQMGYGMREINEAAIDYLYFTRRGINKSVEVNTDVNRSFLTYAKQSDLLSKLYGMSLQQQNQNASRLLSDNVALIQMNREGPLTAQKIVMGARHLSMVYGENYAQLLKTSLINMSNVDEAATQLRILFPGADDSIRVLLTAARDNNVSVDQFSTMLDEVAVQSIYANSRQAQGLDGLLRVMASGGGDMDQMYQSIYPVLQIMNRYGNINEMTVDQLRENYRRARAEMDSRENIATVINGLAMSARSFSSSFFIEFIRGLSSMSGVVGDAKLSEKFQALGRDFGYLATTGWDNLNKFIKFASTTEGQQYLLSYGNIIFAKYGNIIGLRFKRAYSAAVETMFNGALPQWALELFPGYINAAEYQNQLNAVRFQTAIRMGELNRVTQGGTTEAPPPSALPGQEGAPGGPVYTLPTGTVYMDPRNFGVYQGTGVEAVSVRRLPEYDMVGNVIDDRQDVSLTDSIWSQLFGGGSGLARNPAFAREYIRLLSLQQGAPRAGLSRLNYPGGFTWVNSKYVDSMQRLIDYLGFRGFRYGSLTGWSASSDIWGQQAGATLSIRGADTTLGAWLDQNPEVKSEVLGMLSYMRGESTHYLGAGGFYDTRGGSSGLISAMTNFDGSHARPNEFRYGTLGVTGSLFADFGIESTVTVHDEEGIFTPQQVGNAVVNYNQKPVKDMLKTLNTSISTLIALTKEELDLDRDRLALSNG